MNVTQAQNADAVAAQVAAARTDTTADPAAFRAVLAQASTDTTTEAPLPEGVKLRKGEEVQKVEGHAYVEVTAGAREGMYINTSGNSRHGEAFVLVDKAGFDYHIYGSGDDRVVVRAAKRDNAD
jgi:hypothetical protein